MVKMMIVGQRTGDLQPVPDGEVGHGFGDDQKADSLALRHCS